MADRTNRMSRRELIAGAGAAALAGGGPAAAKPPSDMTWLPAWRIREMIVAGEISARSVTDHFLARIRRLEPRFHAFITVDEAGARAAAAQADADLARGLVPGPLFGIPIAVKDNLWAKGMPATGGSLIFAKFRPTIDDTLVERLRKAGAIIVGKTNMPEFAAWPRSQSWMAGESVNPWGRGRISGASSGGSAVAVAAGMVPAAIGTDGGGSIRIPSALCGLVGLFPTLGRVPVYGGFHFSPNGSAGPMTRSVLDAAIIEQVIAGPDSRMPGAILTPAPDVLAGLDRGVAGLRVAWSPDFGWAEVDPRVALAAAGAVDALAKAGAQVEKLAFAVPHPWGDGAYMKPLQAAVAAGRYPSAPTGEVPEAADAEPWLIASSTRAREIPFGLPQFRALLDANQGLLSPPQRSLRTLPMAPGPAPHPAELLGVMDRVFKDHDVLCSPTMPVPAPASPRGWAQPYATPFAGTDFTFIANATGCPAVTVPCGLAGGLPVGFQIIGRAGDEPTVLRAARALEKSLPAFPHARVA